VGAVRYAGATLFEIVRRVREELGANTICGASNISFGLPERPTLNAVFLAMAIAAGLPCAITNPLEPEIRKAILAADVMMGHDENCGRWLMAHRVTTGAESGDDTTGTRRERRRGRRESRMGE
jgi:5-methyltetrahydrofolate--homocysteine methyltransferase